MNFDQSIVSFCTLDLRKKISLFKALEIARKMSKYPKQHKMCPIRTYTGQSIPAIGLTISTKLTP